MLFIPCLNRHQDDGTDVVYSGSQMIVITDAISKQAHLKSKVISEANDRGVCIHFLLVDLMDYLMVFIKK